MSWPCKSGGVHIAGVREGLGSPMRVGVVRLSKVTLFNSNTRPQLLPLKMPAPGYEGLRSWAPLLLTLQVLQPLPSGFP